MPLRLKSLELHGYKTFAARTYFEFAPGITAIVGPNGAGKSNVADALRWVLGEQSYSLMRGKKTEDMIFSGSEHKPRAGMASAEVNFDNSDKWLPVDFSEVAMTRRAYRDGQNDYLLNGQRVRLRDMNEMLAAAGLSERTYTMVGQGLVDASLALKAEERRRLFEEAAGVGLYRVRREDAIRRLESTLRNLERVQDILTEIEPRLKTLERQARRAREYAAAQTDLREVLREWYGYHWSRAQADLQEAQQNVLSHQSRSQTAHDSLDARRAEHASLREKMAEIREQLAAWNREASELHREREAVNVSLAVLQERQRGLEGSIDTLRIQVQSRAGESELARQRRADAEQEVTRAEAAAAGSRNELTEAQTSLRARQAGRGSIEGRQQEARATLASLQARRVELEARRDAEAAHAVEQVSRIESAAQAVKAAEAAHHEATSQQGRAQTRREDQDRQTQGLVKRADIARQALVAAETQLRDLGIQRDAVVGNELKLRAQLEVLEQAEQSLAGHADGAKFLLAGERRGRLGVRGSLAAMLQLPAGLEIAIGAALGDAIDGVVLEERGIQNALELLESENGGRAAMLPLETKAPTTLPDLQDPEMLGIASRLVRASSEAQPALEALLANTYVVRTRAAALRLRRTIPPAARLVTLRGEVFRGDGLITAGRVASSSVLSRPRQKRELQESLSDVAIRKGQLDSSVSSASREVDRARSDVDVATAELEAARTALVEAQAQERLAGLAAERQAQLLEWHGSRLTEIGQEKKAAEDRRAKLDSEIGAVESDASEAAREVQALAIELTEQTVEEVLELVAYWTTRVAVAEQATESARMRLVEQTQAAEKLSEEAHALEERLGQDRAALSRIDQERAELSAKERQLQEGSARIQELIGPAEKELDRLQTEEAALEAQESESLRGSSSADKLLTQFEIDLVRRQEALETLRSRIVDDFGLVSFEYAASVEGPVPLPFEGLVEELRNVPELDPELEDQLTQRRARLRRLGLINPEAARDYEEESNRYSFLTAQVQDLRQAEADLRHVISELDEMTRQEFSRTYAAVDRQFRAIFTRLFGGGSAHLSMTDPNNLIETGIEIEARLPGRREQGLSLLSGGERSLTAIALVFALLKVSPTPVCVLDEVDAMLDEANVGRFRDLLAELSRQTQFVVITHNRNTVQAAEFIYGVTMGRDSTSQIISLRLDELSEEMLGSSSARA